MPYRVLFFFALFFLAFNISAQGFGPYQAEVSRVIDGDTIELNIHIWPKLTQNVKLRLSGVNTPEKRGKVSDCEKEAGQKATNFTQRFLQGVKTVTVTDIKLGKYAGRVLGNLSKQRQDLGQALIQTGHAKPYKGGKRELCCGKQ